MMRQAAQEGPGRLLDAMMSNTHAICSDTLLAIMDATEQAGQRPVAPKVVDTGSSYMRPMPLHIAAKLKPRPPGTPVSAPRVMVRYDDAKPIRMGWTGKMYFERYGTTMVISNGHVRLETGIYCKIGDFRNGVCLYCELPEAP